MSALVKRCYYMAADVATSCGWSLLSAEPRGKVCRHGGGVLDLKTGAAAQVSNLAEIARIQASYEPSGNGGVSVAVEEPYLDENPKTLKVLARLVGRFEQAFEQAGVPVLLVPAQTWQTAVLGCGPRTPRAERKKLARIWAKAMFGRDLEEDEADATALAYYLATKGRLG